MSLRHFSKQQKCPSWKLLWTGFLLTSSLMSASCAPVSHRKKFYKLQKDNSFKRVERRYMPPSSPIHFINPFMSLPPTLNTVHQFYAPLAPSPPMIQPASQIFKLPLRIFSNAKPFGVLSSGSALDHTFIPKPPVIDFLPHAVANIIRLPLKFMSNAKPIGVYFNKPSYNFI